MAQVEIYSTMMCPFCFRAKRLLTAKGVEFNEIDIDTDPAKRREMMDRTGRTSVPQIFIDGAHIGGCDELHALDAKGGLDPLLQA